MIRLCLSFLCILTFTHSSYAHFVFVVPTGEGQTLAVIFSDSLKPDAAVKPELLKLQGFTGVDEAGKIVDLKAEASTTEGIIRKVTLLKGIRSVSVVGDYGLIQRGEGETYRLIYRSAYFTSPTDIVTKDAPAELTVRKAEAGFQFLALAAGKPVVNADVTVYEPGSEKTITVKTDKNGLTPVFNKNGLYGARFLVKDPTPGEFEGKKYKAIHTYGTAVMQHGK